MNTFERFAEKKVLPENTFIIFLRKSKSVTVNINMHSYLRYFEDRFFEGKNHDKFVKSD